MLCCRKIPAAKNSMDKRGRYQESPTKISCFTMPKNFATESLYVVFQITSGIEKDCGLERGGVSRFSVEKLLSYRSKKFCKGNLQCVTNFG